MPERGRMSQIKKEMVLKGNIVCSREDKSLCCIPNGYVVSRDGICEGVYEQLPDDCAMLPLTDCGDDLILPGMTDLHVHAPQYTFRGIGMDMELLEWLQVHTFPEESKYRETSYAKAAYEIFVQDLMSSLTTRACIFATLHKEATLELMKQLEESGLVTYVGKVNMDRNGSDTLCEKDVRQSIADTTMWLKQSGGRFERTMPILTPRFIPTCTDKLMEELGRICRESGLRVQSHLSENPSEVAWVKELVPASKSYADAYHMFGMLGDKAHPAVMAHCIYCSEPEIKLMKQQGVYVAHCPDSNLNLASGIAPIRRYLEQEIPVGLGTDVAGGSSLSMTKAVTLAIQSSKMYWRLVDKECRPLTFAEAFYLATIGGGSYFGKVGSFLPGYEFDAVVVNDRSLKSAGMLSVEERLERMFYDEKGYEIEMKFVRGKKIEC